jgi:hypothetical protein
MAFDPAAGTEGRIRVGAGSTVVAGVRSWRINKQLAEIPVNHFELSADADGIVWQTFLKGLAGATVTLEGHYNVDATDKTEGGTPGLAVGADVVLDLLFTRTPFGYLDLAGFITTFEAGTNIDNQTATFTATIRLTGAVGKGTA